MGHTLAAEHDNLGFQAVAHGRQKLGIKILEDRMVKAPKDLSQTDRDSLIGLKARVTQLGGAIHPV